MGKLRLSKHGIAALAALLVMGFSLNDCPVAGSNGESNKGDGSSSSQKHEESVSAKRK